MAKQTVNLGTAVNDGTGDTLRVGGDKINDNFDELYDVANPTPTAENDFSVASAALAWTKKTLAQVKVILGLTQGVQTATYANPTTTINATTYKNWILTVTGDTVISMTNVTDGDAGTINVIVSGAGGYTITFDAMFTKKYGATGLTVVTADDNLVSWTKLGSDILYTIIQKV